VIGQEFSGPLSVHIFAEPIRRPAVFLRSSSPLINSAPTALRVCPEALQWKEHHEASHTHCRPVVRNLLPLAEPARHDLRTATESRSPEQFNA
jgi:hypothetical protein